MLPMIARTCLLTVLAAPVAAVEVMRSPAPGDTLEIERSAPPRGANQSAESSEAVTLPKSQTMSVNQPESGGCLLSSGPFALPAGTRSVDWKLVNRGAASARVEVTVYRLRIGASAEVVYPGTLRKVLPHAHEMHNANSVGSGRPFETGSDYEVVVWRSDARVLPAVSFWSDHGNSEIPGTRIGPEGFVAVGGDCHRRGAHD
ncbi:MAG: hypothetical protein IPG63_07725 [Xanthomonadales bacterium]|nr:hypothetical protein [Xanthomonadales bacterium]